MNEQKMTIPAALLLIVGLATPALAQFGGPQTVVVAEAIKRSVAPRQTFVASVMPLRESVVGSAVDGRVVEFLSHAELAYVGPVGGEEGAAAAQYSARVARIPQLTAQGPSAKAAEAALAERLQEYADSQRVAGRPLVENEASPPAPGAGESETWISYQWDGSKVVHVRPGQPLARLREGTIDILVRAAKSQYDLRQAESKEARETHELKIDQAEARLRSAQAQQQYAAANYERNRRLYAQNRSVSREELELSQTSKIRAEQDVLDAELGLRLAERPDAIVQAVAREEAAKAEYDRLVDRRRKYTVRSPFDGFVVAEHTEVGAWLDGGEDVAEVVQLDPVEVRAFIPELYVSQLQIGGPASVHCKALRLGPDEAAPVGRITGIVAEAVTRSRTFPVKIQVPNPGYRLKAGMLAEVELAVGSEEPATLVPKDALDLERRVVVLAEPDPDDPKAHKTKIVPVEIITGKTLGRWIAVEGNVQPGDLVVEKGNERLRQPGIPLAVQREGGTPLPE